jgi:hypothetical protein
MSGIASSNHPDGRFRCLQRKYGFVPKFKNNFFLLPPIPNPLKKAQSPQNSPVRPAHVARYLLSVYFLSGDLSRCDAPCRLRFELPATPTRFRFGIFFPLSRSH